MDSHVNAGLWFCGLFTFIGFYVICSVIYYFIELLTYEYESDIDNEILVFNEGYTEVFIIYCEDTHSA